MTQRIDNNVTKVKVRLRNRPHTKGTPRDVAINVRRDMNQTYCTFKQEEHEYYVVYKDVDQTI